MYTIHSPRAYAMRYTLVLACFMPLCTLLCSERSPQSINKSMIELLKTISSNTNQLTTPPNQTTNYYYNLIVCMIPIASIPLLTINRPPTRTITKAIMIDFLKTHKTPLLLYGGLTGIMLYSIYRTYQQCQQSRLDIHQNNQAIINTIQQSTTELTQKIREQHTRLSEISRQLTQYNKEEDLAKTQQDHVISENHRTTQTKLSQHGGALNTIISQLNFLVNAIDSQAQSPYTRSPSSSSSSSSASSSSLSTGPSASHSDSYEDSTPPNDNRFNDICSSSKS